VVDRRVEFNQINLQLDAESLSDLNGLQEKDKTIMIEEGQITLRNAGFLVAQRGFHILGSLLFAMSVPE